MAETKTINGVDIPALGKAIHEFRHTPDLARFQFRVRNQWLGDAGHSRTTISEFYGAGKDNTSPNRPFRLEADEPEVLLGRDAGPNPVEHLLNALAACLTGAMAYHAAARGIRIEALESELEGDIDLRGFLGISPDVRRGYQSIRVTFHVKSDGSEEELAECARFSPVFDVVSNGTSVDLRVRKSEEVMAGRAEQEEEVTVPVGP